MSSSSQLVHRGWIVYRPAGRLSEARLQVAISALAGAGLGVRFMLASWLAAPLELRNDFYLGGETRSVTNARLGLAFVMPAE